MKENNCLSYPKLKPCPFCGKFALLQLDSDHHGDFFNLGCSDEKCIATWVYYAENTLMLDSCIKKWNTRIPEQRIREIFPKILEALGHGAWCVPEASVEFLENIPAEIKLFVKKSR